MRSLVILLFIFSVNLLSQDSSGTAVIFHSSLSGSAGDAIYLQGSGFGTAPKVQFAYNDNNWTNLPTLSASDQAVTLQLPNNQTRLPDLVQIRISSDGYNWSTPVAINQAKAYSFDTNQIAPGSTFRIFGRNLIFSRTPTVRLVDSSDGSSHSANVNTGASQAFALSATAPSDIRASHTYSVYVSNGYNGNAASGGETVAPATLQGRSSGPDYWNLGVPWAADLNFTNNVYNVMTDPRLPQHAHADGSDGDRQAIGIAIAAAEHDGGGIVYLPAGTYNLYFQNGCGIALFNRVVLMGQGANNTVVNWGFGAPPGIGTGYAVCFAQSQSGVSDITFNNVNQSGNWPESAIGTNASELFIQRTNWKLSTAQWLVLSQDTNITMQNSSIIQGLDTSYNGPIDASYSTNWVFRNNTVKYVGGELQFDGSNGAVFENNTVIRDASIPTPSSVITHVMAGNWAQHFMLLNNTFEVQGGTLPLKNDGEVAGSEAGGVQRRDEFRGTVQYVGSNSITDYSQNFNWSSNNAIPNLHVGAILAIVSGKGAGEWATITNISVDGHIIWVDHNWPVMPAPGSHYATFDWSSWDWIIAGNTLNDNEKGIEFFDASIRDILITGNRITNDGEILISPSEQPDGAGMFNLVLNTQITNNTVIDNNHLRPAAISVVAREDRDYNNFGTSVIGVELRGNSVTGFVPNTFYNNTSLDDSKALSEGINVYWQWQTVANFQDQNVPSLLATIIQGNSLTNSAAAVLLNTGDYQTTLVSNAANNADSPKIDQSIMGASHASVDTVTATAAPISTPTPPSNPTPPSPPTPTPTPNPTPIPPTVPKTTGWTSVTVGTPGSKMRTSAVKARAVSPSSSSAFDLPVGAYALNPDSFTMVAQTVSTDGAAIAKITVPTDSVSSTEGMITFRATTSTASAFVSLGQLQNGSLLFQYRPYQGGAVTNWIMPHPQTPLWVKLVKSNNLFQAFYSNDGDNWTYAVQIGAAFGSDTYYVGMQSLSTNTSGPQISFSNVSIP